MAFSEYMNFNTYPLVKRPKANKCTDDKLIYRADQPSGGRIKSLKRFYCRRKRKVGNILVLCNQFHESFAKNRDCYFKKNYNTWFGNEKCFKKYLWLKRFQEKRKDLFVLKKESGTYLSFI